MTIYDVDEGTTRIFTHGPLLDETGAPFNGNAFITLTLTFYDLATDTIINGRNGQNVLNINGVTVSTGGLLTWIMTPEDNAPVNADFPYEMRRALFTGTWNPGGGVRTWRKEVTFRLRNLRRVP